jgi:hypothetical protein
MLQFVQWGYQHIHISQFSVLFLWIISTSGDSGHYKFITWNLKASQYWYVCNCVLNDAKSNWGYTANLLNRRATVYIIIRRMLSSGMLRRVVLVRTDVSEEPSASFIRVTRIGELGTRATRCNIPEDAILHRRGLAAMVPGSYLP